MLGALKARNTNLHLGRWKNDCKDIPRFQRSILCLDDVSWGGAPGFNISRLWR